VGDTSLNIILRGIKGLIRCLFVFSILKVQLADWSRLK